MEYKLETLNKKNFKTAGVSYADHGVTQHHPSKTWSAQTQAYKQYTLKHQSPPHGLLNSQHKESTVGVVYKHPYYPVAFLTAKGSHTLLDKMDGALAQLIYDGTVDQLKAKWHA